MFKLFKNCQLLTMYVYGDLKETNLLEYNR